MPNDTLARKIATIIPESKSVETLVAESSTEIEELLKGQKKTPPSPKPSTAEKLINIQFKAIVSKLTSVLVHPNDSIDESLAKRKSIEDRLRRQIAQIQ
jgi:hypothetical protein